MISTIRYSKFNIVKFNIHNCIMKEELKKNNKMKSNSLGFALFHSHNYILNPFQNFLPTKWIKSKGLVNNKGISNHSECFNPLLYKSYFSTSSSKLTQSTKLIRVSTEIGSPEKPNLFHDSSIIKNPICAKYYQNIISQDLCLKQNYKNIMELDSFQQIACNTSSKNYTIDREAILPAMAALEIITGQKPKSTCAKKSISSFKLRQFQILGCKTSLRGFKMYDFLEKYISIQSALTATQPNLKDRLKSLNGRDYVILNCNVFPELQKHDELFQNVSGIQISFSLTQWKKPKSRKKVDYKYPKSILLLSSAFQLL